MQLQEVVFNLTNEKGKTAKLLASEIGISENEFFEKLSNGGDIELICKICDALGISIDELYGYYKKYKKIIS